MDNKNFDPDIELVKPYKEEIIKLKAEVYDKIKEIEVLENNANKQMDFINFFAYHFFGPEKEVSLDDLYGKVVMMSSEHGQLKEEIEENIEKENVVDVEELDN